MEQEKTIWCISKYASPPKYGVGARLFYVAKEFSNLGAKTLLISSDANHLASYPATNEIYNSEQYGELEHVWIQTKKYARSASIKRFLSWLDFEKKLFRLPKVKYPNPDIVIISSLSLFTIVYGVRLKSKYKCKLVFEVRDIYPLTLTEEFGVSKWNPMVIFLGILEKFGYKRADLIVGTMPNLKQHVKERIGREKEVYYSPLGIHERWFRKMPTVNEEVDALFAKAGKFVVGYAGSMGISNALGSFVEAIKKLADDKDIYFVLVGAGDLKAEITKQLSNYDNVIIGPKIHQDDVPYFLSKCDVLYLSTHDSKIWKYGQSMNKLIDYMMAARPVIASYSGYPSMLNEAKAGMFIPTNDEAAIVRAVQYYKSMSKEERTKCGMRGRTWVEANHRYETIALKYYHKLLEL